MELFLKIVFQYRFAIQSFENYSILQIIDATNSLGGIIPDFLFRNMNCYKPSRVNLMVNKGQIRRMSSNQPKIAGSSLHTHVCPKKKKKEVYTIMENKYYTIKL